MGRIGMNEASSIRDTAPRKFGMGAAIRRKEDPALIVGRGHFTDDYTPEGTLHAFVLRSAMAHARIRLNELDAARAAPGVSLILTGADVADYQGPPAKEFPPIVPGTERHFPHPTSSAMSAIPLPSSSPTRPKRRSWRPSRLTSTTTRCRP
jgi:carbon-monoxide dehydrogenase large subunit